MATHDYVIANASGAAVRQDINNALAAIVSNNSSATEPGTTYAFQFWFDTTNNILKIRNAANSAWIDWITTTATALLPDGTVGAPGLTFASETDSGLYRIAANTLGIATSGTERVEISDTGIIINEGGDDADVRIEGNSNANLVFIDAGNDRVGIGVASPGQLLQIGEGDTGLGANVHSIARIEGRAVAGGQQVATLEFNQLTNASAEFVGASIGIESSAGTRSESELVFKVSQAANTDATEAMRLSHDGNLGIGTSSPSYLLHVGSAVGDGISIGANNAGFITRETEGLRITGGSTNKNISFVTSGTEAMRVDTSGNVGIGVTSIGNIANRSQLAIGGSDGGLIDFLVGTTSEGRIFASDTTFTIRAAQSDGNLVFQTGGSNDRMYIDSSGRVGIGTTTPSRQLALYNSSAPVFQLVNSTTGTTASDGTLLYLTSSDFVIENQEAGNIRIQNNGSERMRIQSDGTTLIGTSSTTINSSNFGTRIGGSSTSIGFFATSRNVGSGSGVAIFYGQSGELQVKGDGDCENTNNRYTGISDIKLKENVVDASSQWDDIKALQVRNYNFKEETGYSTHTQIGLVAQEVETVCPGLVGETNDTDDELNETGTVTKSVAYSVLYMKAVKALQEAMDRIETLEAKVAALEAG